MSDPLKAAGRWSFGKKFGPQNSTKESASQLCLSTYFSYKDQTVTTCRWRTSQCLYTFWKTRSGVYKPMLTRQRSPLRRSDGPHGHPSKQSQLGRVGGGLLVLPLVAPPACADSRAPVGGLRLLNGAQVVEVAAVGARADGSVQAHGALARLLGFALASPHVQTWEGSQWWVRLRALNPKQEFWLVNAISWLRAQKDLDYVSISGLILRIKGFIVWSSG